MMERSNILEGGYAQTLGPADLILMMMTLGFRSMLGRRQGEEVNRADSGTG